MPWIKIIESPEHEIWLRSESIIGLSRPEQDVTGTRLLLVSGATVNVVEERDHLLRRIKDAEGTAPRDRRVGFPAD